MLNWTILKTWQNWIIIPVIISLFAMGFVIFGHYIMEDNSNGE